MGHPFPPTRPHRFPHTAPFLTALSFLTRLTLGQAASLDMLQASVPWYPAVGLVLGVLCTAPLWLAHILGCPLLPWPAAWLYVTLGFWLTRGLHWDGLADLGDAWGSNADGERFWRILRDSRMGAYGAMALLLCFSLLLITIQAHMTADHFAPLLLAPIIGRSAAVLLAASTPPHDPTSLGGMACSGATPAAALWAAGGGLISAVVLLSLPATLLLAAGLALLLHRLRALALAQGGCNGDFLGAAILLGELVTLLAALPPNE